MKLPLKNHTAFSSTFCTSLEMCSSEYRGMKKPILSWESAFVFLLSVKYSSRNNFICIDSVWNSALCTETSTQFYDRQDFKISVKTETAMQDGWNLRLSSPVLCLREAGPGVSEEVWLKHNKETVIGLFYSGSNMFWFTVCLWTDLCIWNLSSEWLVGSHGIIQA